VITSQFCVHLNCEQTVFRKKIGQPGVFPPIASEGWSITCHKFFLWSKIALCSFFFWVFLIFFFGQNKALMKKTQAFSFTYVLVALLLLAALAARVQAGYFAAYMLPGLTNIANTAQYNPCNHKCTIDCTAIRQPNLGPFLECPYGKQYFVFVLENF